MFTVLKKRNYQPLNCIEISQDKLIANYQYLSLLSPTIKIAPVLKSNAYGHGITLIGPIVDALHPPFICVDSLFEAYELQKIGVKSPILIMGYVNPKSLNTKKLPFWFAVSDEAQVHTIAMFQSHAKIHLFVDTGMHREGIRIENLTKIIKIAKEKKLQIDGLMSHFAMSDKANNILTTSQLEHFIEAQKIIHDNGVYPSWIHIANSSGILNHTKYKEKLGNVARVGKAFYGYDPENLSGKLKPALQLKTHIAQVKYIKKSETVGYDFTYTAPKDIVAAVLPIGYNDGIERGLSNTGIVTIHGIECKIIGRISMNITTIDISEVENVNEGDEVIVYSTNTRKNNSIDKAALLSNTITHELLVHLNGSTKRILV